MGEAALSLAVIGAGLMGRRHMAAIERCPGARLAAVVDPLLEAAPAGAALHRDLGALLAGPAPVDGVIIATPNGLHGTQGLACVAAGAPMLVEKPIADTAAGAEELVAAAEAASVPVLVGHHRRHNPLIAAAKAAIERGEIGRIRAAEASFWLYKPDDYFSAAWRTEPGAGPIFINLIHDIDLMLHLVGPAVSVQAAEASVARGFAVEDTAAAILGFQNGALGVVTISDAVVAPWSWEMTAGENPAYPETGQACYRIGGDQGSLSIPDGAIWSQEPPQSWWRPIARRQIASPPAPDPIDLQLAHFLDVIRGRAAPLVTGRDGLAALRVVEAIKRASTTGERVMLA